MPWKSLDVELFHEWIRIEFLYVVYTWLAPKTLEEHHCTDHGRNACCVAYALHTSLFVSFLMATVVIYIISMFLAILYATDAATDRCFAFVVLAKFLWIWKNSLEELERYDLYDFIARTVCLRSLVTIVLSRSLRSICLFYWKNPRVCAGIQ